MWYASVSKVSSRLKLPYLCKSKICVSSRTNVVIQVVPIKIFQLFCCEWYPRYFIVVMVRGMKPVTVMNIKWRVRMSESRETVLCWQILGLFKNTLLNVKVLQFKMSEWLVNWCGYQYASFLKKISQNLSGTTDWN